MCSARRPRSAPDGEYVYVTSTGYSLVCFTKAGERLWPSTSARDGASAENNSGSIKVQSPTPSVDEDGTVYALAGFNEPNKGAGGKRVLRRQRRRRGRLAGLACEYGREHQLPVPFAGRHREIPLHCGAQRAFGAPEFPGLRQIVGRPGGRAARQRRLYGGRAAAQKTAW